MKLRSLLNKQKRAAFVADMSKGVKHYFLSPQQTTPVFIFGRQRSGTSMLMYCFHMHPDTVVHDEHKDNLIFRNYQIRNFHVIHDTLQSSRTPFACFKPICDSHKIKAFLEEFPSASNIWMYRDYKDAAWSALQKFEHATRAIRLICAGETGGGWFQEGISSKTDKILKYIRTESLTDFDFACLAWWARNQIFLEQKLNAQPNVFLIQYEALASNPAEELAWVFNRLGLSQHDRCAQYINASSVKKRKYPALASDVRLLCEQTLTELNRFYWQTRSTRPESGVTGSGNQIVSSQS